MNSPLDQAGRTSAMSHRETRQRVEAGLAKRYRAERRFRWLGAGAVCVSVGFLVFFLWTIVGQGYSAFFRTQILLDINFDAALIDPAGDRDPDDLSRANYMGLITAALSAQFPEESGRSARRALRRLVSGAAAYDLHRERRGGRHRRQ